MTRQAHKKTRWWKTSSVVCVLLRCCLATRDAQVILLRIIITTNPYVKDKSNIERGSSVDRLMSRPGISCWKGKAICILQRALRWETFEGHQGQDMGQWRPMVSVACMLFQAWVQMLWRRYFDGVYVKPFIKVRCIRTTMSNLHVDPANIMKVPHAKTVQFCPYIHVILTMSDDVYKVKSYSN